MDLSFILLRPKYPSNLGSTARAMRTMGFNQLILVDPQTNHLHERAVKTAKHSSDILENAAIFKTLEEALAGVDLSIATSNKIRKQQSACWSSKEIGAKLAERCESATRVGVLFGPESTGLTNPEVDLCDLICTVPTTCQNPSLNLAQAVMILSYELSNVPLQIPDHRQHEFESATVQDYQQLKGDIDQLLSTLSVPADSTLRKKVLDRIELLNKTDLYLMHKVKNRFLKFTGRPLQ